MESVPQRVCDLSLQETPCIVYKMSSSCALDVIKSVM